MSETPDTPAAATEASHPAARKVKRPWMTWIKLSCCSLSSYA